MRARSMLHAALAALVLIAFVACSAASGGSPDVSADPARPREVARVVSVSSTVPDVRAATRAVRGAIERHEGFVASASEVTGSGSHARVVARVPAARLAALRAELHALGELTSDEERMEDVTDARADVGARLRNARREEERLLALMGERTASLADVLAVEARLSAVRERIEELETSERTLRDRVALAEVHVYLAPRPQPFWHEPGATFTSAASFGFEAVAAVTVGIGAVVVAAGPTVALGALGIALLVWLARLALRRRSYA